MKNETSLKLADLSRPLQKTIEHFQDALLHVENSTLSTEAKADVVRYINLAAGRIAEAVRS